MKNRIVLIFGILILFPILVTSATGVNYIINNGTVSINDSTVYLSANPAITMGRDVLLNFKSKVYSGDVDIAMGFINDTYKPTSFWVFNPHNVTLNFNYTCDYDFGYTTTPEKRAWCYQTYSNGSTTVYFNHTFNTGDIATKTVYWDETHQEDYKLKNIHAIKVNYKLGGVNRWTLIRNLAITQDKKYKAKIKIRTNNYNASIEKYWFCILPSSYNLNIKQAHNNGNLYCLDPWAGTPPDGGLTYYNFSGTTDLWGSNDAVNTGCDVSTDYPSFNISGNSSDDSFSCVLANTDYIDMSSIADSLSTGDPLSISFWIKDPNNWGTTDNYATLIGMYYDDNHRWFIMNKADGTVRFLSYADVTHHGYADISVATTGLTDGVWNHIVLTSDGSTNTEVWVNGKNTYNMTYWLYTGFSNTYDLLLSGYSANGGQNYFGANYDSVKIYNRSLNSSEIKNLYNYGEITAPDTTPPATITNLVNQGQGIDWLYWTWTNPTDTDFNHSNLYLNNSLITTTSNNYYNFTGLSPSTTYEIEVTTTDTNNNTNSTQITDINETLASSGFSCPGLNHNWQINMSENHHLTTNCDLGTGNITFTGTGTFYINSTLTTTKINNLVSGMVIYVDSNGRLNING